MKEPLKERWPLDFFLKTCNLAGHLSKKKGLGMGSVKVANTLLKT